MQDEHISSINWEVSASIIDTDRNENKAQLGGTTQVNENGGWFYFNDMFVDRPGDYILEFQVTSPLTAVGQFEKINASVTIGERRMYAKITKIPKEVKANENFSLSVEIRDSEDDSVTDITWRVRKIILSQDIFYSSLWWIFI